MWAAASPSRLAPGTFASDPDCVRSTARRFAGRPRPGRAWRGGARADPRRLASTPATLATTPTASSSPSDDASLAEEDPFVARRRRAEEALMSAIEFDAAWLTDATVRGRITGEGAVAPPRKPLVGAPGINQPRPTSPARRRPATPPPPPPPPPRRSTTTRSFDGSRRRRSTPSSSPRAPPATSPREAATAEASRVSSPPHPPLSRTSTRDARLARSFASASVSATTPTSSPRCRRIPASLLAPIPERDRDRTRRWNVAAPRDAKRRRARCEPSPRAWARACSIPIAPRRRHRSRMDARMADGAWEVPSRARLIARAISPFGFGTCGVDRASVDASSRSLRAGPCTATRRAWKPPSFDSIGTCPSWTRPCSCTARRSARSDAETLVHGSRD